MSTVEDFRNEVKNLSGKECWGVVGGPGTGSVISLSIGEKYPSKNPSKNTFLSDLVRSNDSEYSLLVSCPWRIEDSSEILCGSHHTNDNDGPYQSGFERIVGSNIIETYCSAPALDLRLDFSNGVALSVFCAEIGIDDDECYAFGTPNGWFTVFFDGRIEHNV